MQYLKAEGREEVATRLLRLCENLAHTPHGQNTPSKRPQWLQLLRSRFACLLLFQTAKNQTQRNRRGKDGGLNFHYAVIIEIRIKKYKGTTIALSNN